MIGKSEEAREQRVHRARLTEARRTIREHRGPDRVAGWLGAEAVAAWAAEGREPQTAPQMTGAELAERMGEGGEAGRT